MTKGAWLYSEFYCHSKTLTMIIKLTNTEGTLFSLVLFSVWAKTRNIPKKKIERDIPNFNSKLTFPTTQSQLEKVLQTPVSSGFRFQDLYPTQQSYEYLWISPEKQSLYKMLQTHKPREEASTAPIKLSRAENDPAASS